MVARDRVSLRAVSLLSRIRPAGPSGFGYGSTADDVTTGLDLRGQSILLTGCNSGLGHETIRVLAQRGARVLAAARTLDKAIEATRGLTGEFVPLACELADPASIRACIRVIADGGYALDAIICNAGIMALPKLKQAHGYELQFLTNHVGHFILVTGLLERLTEHGRVVMLSSDAHRLTPPGGIAFDNLSGEKKYHPWKFYGQSKLANLLFAKQLAKRLRTPTQTANAVHPGVIDTNLARSAGPVIRWGYRLGAPVFMKSIPQGASTQVFVATHPSLAGVTGTYFANCNVAKPSRDGQDDALAARLWEATESIVAAL